MSVKFLQRLCDEELIELLKDALDFEELKLVSVERHDEFVLVTARSVWGSGTDDPVECEDVYELTDFEKPVVEFGVSLKFWARAMYQKFGQEYSDAFFRNFWGIGEQEK